MACKYKYKFLNPIKTKLCVCLLQCFISLRAVAVPPCAAHVQAQRDLALSKLFSSCFPVQTDLCCQITLDHSRAHASVQQAVLSLTAETLSEDCNISWAWALFSPGETLQAALWVFMSHSVPVLGLKACY